MTWRPLPGSQDEGRGPRRLRDSLDKVTRGLGGADATALAAIFGRWDNIVGAHVAAHSKPVRLTGGTLTIAVDEPGWATQLTYLEADLRRRIEAVAGAGVVLRVRVSIRSG